MLTEEVRAIIPAIEHQVPAVEKHPRFFGLVAKAHAGLYKLSGGRLGGGMKGAPVCLVDNVGRKSGQVRRTPLIYVRDGDAIVIIASKGGSNSDPAWWLNLQANPDAEVQIGAERTAVRARQASAEERERLFPKLVGVWPDYEGYQANTEREIPVILLDPRGAAEASA